MGEVGLDLRGAGSGWVTVSVAVDLLRDPVQLTLFSTDTGGARPEHTAGFFAKLAVGSASVWPGDRAMAEWDE